MSKTRASFLAHWIKNQDIGVYLVTKEPPFLANEDRSNALRFDFRSQAEEVLKNLPKELKKRYEVISGHVF